MRKKNNDKKKKGLIVAIFVSAIFMAIGYAALQANLTIYSVGKIYSDWDVRFTDAKCDITSSYTAVAPALGMECFAGDTLSTGVNHLGNYDAGIDQLTDGRGGIELYLYTEFATPEDVTEYEIDITNYSSMWDAMLYSITQGVPTANDTNKDWILYDFSNDLAAEEVGSINEDTGNATIIPASSDGVNFNKVTFTITAYWNPAYDGIVPDSAIKKDVETEADANTTTYTQEDTFLLIWDAVAP